MEDPRLSAQPRETLGKQATAKLRQAGRVPASLYGFRKDVRSISLPAEDVQKLVSSRRRVVDVELNGDVDKVVVQDVQWDTFSTRVQHLDLKRVDPDGVATVDVPIELVGEPIAVKAGAILRKLVKTVKLTCSDFRMPKKIVARTSTMNVGDRITAGNLKVPGFVTLETAPDTVMVELVDPKKADVQKSEDE